MPPSFGWPPGLPDTVRSGIDILEHFPKASDLVPIPLNERATFVFRVQKVRHFHQRKANHHDAVYFDLHDAPPDHSTISRTRRQGIQ